jgi:hypothetical protein
MGPGKLLTLGAHSLRAEASRANFPGPLKAERPYGPAAAAAAGAHRPRKAF